MKSDHDVGLLQPVYTVTIKKDYKRYSGKERCNVPISNSLFSSVSYLLNHNISTYIFVLPNGNIADFSSIVSSITARFTIPTKIIVK